MPSTQKALFVESKLGRFYISEHVVPAPGSGQLLVRNEASGLNPVDWKIQKYGIFVDTYPAIIGTDIAGVVEEVGEGVSGFRKGDRVVFQGAWSNDKAGYQQYSLTDAETTAKIPAHISSEAAATIPVAIAAAVAGLYLPKPNGAGFAPPFDISNRGKYSGKPIVVLGGATSVGQYVIQLAKLSGFSPIVTTASSKHGEFLKSLGATHVLDRHLSFAAIAADVAKITSLPIKIVYDAVSIPETQETGYSLLANGGHLVLVLPAVVKPTEGKEITSVLGIWTLPYTRELGVQLYHSLNELLDKGLIQPNRVEVVSGGLRGIVGGLERLQLDLVSGMKLVVRPQETD